MDSQKISLLNTRAFKKSGDHFVISVGSVESNKSHNVSFKDHTFEIEYGEFSSYLTNVNRYLKLARQFAANANEEGMIDLYIKHF
jgi:hypothetical protein